MDDDDFRNPLDDDSIRTFVLLGLILPAMAYLLWRFFLNTATRCDAP